MLPYSRERDSCKSTSQTSVRTKSVWTVGSDLWRRLWSRKNVWRPRWI